MKVEFAPLHIPLARRAQTAAVLQWVFSFLLLDLFIVILHVDNNVIVNKLIKTSDLDPSHNYLFGFHPHGVLVAGAFGNFCTEYTGFQKLFPGLTPYLHILPFWFRCPFFREYIMCAGLVSATKRSVSHVLSNEKGGNISVIVIGGAEESLDARPGSLTLNILKRKGFIKVALKHG
ncbi:2-acylglycerol O-acyltransferase 1 [Varanus komodoensis]|nr:2-acylglycerol O-acyltransferase 1 [Varanus komodoensis]